MRIFISYRRKGNVQRAILLADILRENFGSENVFLDTSDIPIGSSFPDTLRKNIDSADTVIALIGPEWLTSVDDSFRRRIDSLTDWVNIELQTAISRQITTIPTYVGGAQPIKADHFPPNLTSLSEMQLFEIRENFWKDDVSSLVSRLKGVDEDKINVKWPRLSMKYKPDPVSPLKLKDLSLALPDWELREFEVEDGPFKGGRGNEIKRTYIFRSFRDAIDYIVLASNFVDASDHHPRWENVYCSLVVRLSSWDIGHRITDRDFTLARHLDRLFKRYGKHNAEKKDLRVGETQSESSQ